MTLDHLVSVTDGSVRHLETRDAVTHALLATFQYTSDGLLEAVIDQVGRETRITRTSSRITLTSPFGLQTILDLESSGYTRHLTNPADETQRFDFTPGGLLNHRITPRGGRYSFSYNDLGRLDRTINPVGGATWLARNDTINYPNGYSVTVTNSLGDSVTYLVAQPQPDYTVREQISSNGNSRTMRVLAHGRRVLTEVDGTTTTIQEQPDSIWGMLAPVVASVELAAGSGSAARVPGLATLVAGVASQTRPVCGGDPTTSVSRTITRTPLQPNDPYGPLAAYTEEVVVNGRSSTTSYDYQTNTFTVIDPQGQQTKRKLDAQNRLELEEVTNFPPISYGYDPDTGLLETITEDAGTVTRITRMAYDANGFLDTVTDPLNQVTNYSFDRVGRPRAVGLPTGHVQEYRYNPDGLLETSIDPRGIYTVHTYDAHGRLDEVIPDYLATQMPKTGYDYDLADNLTHTIADADGERATTVYDYTLTDVATYAIRQVTDPLDHTTSIRYTENGSVAAITDPLQRTTSASYCAEGWLKSVSTHGNRTTSYSYTSDGQLDTVTDPRGSVTRYSYYPSGLRETSTITGVAVDQTTTYAYDANGRVTSITDGSGVQTRYDYQSDPFGRLARETDGAGNTIGYGYDLLDRVTRTTIGGNVAAEALVMGYVYDAGGRLTHERLDPDGRDLTTEYTYTPANSRQNTWDLGAVTDPNGQTTRYQYTSRGLRKQVKDARGQIWSIAYDRRGWMERLAGPLDRLTTLEYDLVGRRTSLTQGDDTESWFYRADGTLQSYTDIAGRTTRYTYGDPDGRLTQIDYPAGTPDVGFTYNTAGTIATMTDGLGTTSYQYDGLNRLRARTRAGQTVGYTYTAGNRLDQIDYWGTGTVGHDYDRAGRLDTLTPWDQPALDYTFRSSGQLKTLARGNGVTTRADYDSAGRLTALRHTRNGTTLQQFAYPVLDENGNRREQVDADGTTSYDYDELNRLTDVTYPDQTRTSYDYDALGNRTHIDEQQIASYDRHDRRTDSTQSYDANGNLTSDGINQYRYNAANQLTRVVTPDGTQAITTTYGYDGWGNLVRATVDDSSTITTTDYLLDERSSLPQILGAQQNGTTVARYAYGPDGLVAQQVLSDTTLVSHYPLRDGLGSVRALVDATGATVLERSYAPFGAPQTQTGSAASALGFTGELQDGQTGLVYLRARWYDPAQGRFLQRDRFTGGPTRPQSLNRYAYTENNPVNWTDPSGYACVPCLALLLAGVALTLQSSTPRETITPGEANAGNLGLALMGAGVVWMVAPAVVPAAQQVAAYAVAHPASTATMTRLTLVGGVLGAASDTVMVTQALRGDPDAVGDLIVAQQMAAMDGGLPFGDILAAGMLLRGRSQRTFLVSPDGVTWVSERINQRTREEQIAYLVNNVQGLTSEQAEFLLSQVQRRNGSIVFGGSRVRGNAQIDDSGTVISDLDVGFDGLTKGQINRIMNDFNKKFAGSSQNQIIQHNWIFPGSQPSRYVSEIRSPEEFFMRSGVRSPHDGAKAGQPFYPSGYIKVSPDGMVEIVRP